MKHIFKIMAVLVAVSVAWVTLLETSTVPRNYTWLLPIYLVVALGCYGLFMVGFGLMFFPTCPHEAKKLQQDIVVALEFLAKNGVDVVSDLVASYLGNITDRVKRGPSNNKQITFQGVGTFCKTF
ncbi:hypothetical protein EJB05_42170 [Eragrostis curvula]|uniref:Dolichol-phosphate mannosyltransferase subunit 3 n=1 Tax=Eragrostis curvula TaxID=38414 RepID=A0A5J9TCQ7_9POAL|nr:hypothetical protein EJB05_42170 [Eragrostis curvula]